MWNPLSYLFTNNKEVIVEKKPSDDVATIKNCTTPEQKVMINNEIREDKYRLIKLKKFKIDTMKKPNDNVYAAIIGKRRAGKTVLLKDIINKLDYSAENIYLFEDLRYVPPSLHGDVNVNTPDKFEQSFKDKREKLAVYDEIPEQNYQMRKVVYNVRHFSTSVIHLLQYPSLPPSYRENLDFIFIFFDNNEHNKRRLWEHYGGNIPSFEEFKVLLDKVGKDYNCLVIDKRSMSLNWEDDVYWYKADYNE